MIDYTTIREIIESEIADNFTLCPVKYENVPLSDNSVDDYIEIFDRQSFSESTGMGDTSIHMGGVLIINIFTELNTGTARGRLIAQTLSDLLQSKNIEGLSLGVPELRPAEPNESWYQHNLLIPYTTVTGNVDGC